MKYKLLNTNSLKLIALFTMTLDHVAIVFMEINSSLYLVFRIIGRISFPIFAFFLAEGFRYTKNRRKYFLNLLIFAIISQIPYSLLWGAKLSILFTFVIAFGLMYAYDFYILKDKLTTKIKFENCVFFCFFILAAVLISMCMPIDYSFFGILLPLVFYIFNNNVYKSFLAMLILLIIHNLYSIFIINSIDLSNFSHLINIFSILYIIPITFYNGKKGKYNIKYLFYIFYPSHLALLYLLQLLLN